MGGNPKMPVKELVWDSGAQRQVETGEKHCITKSVVEWEIYLSLSVLPESEKKKKSNLTLKNKEPTQQSRDEYTPDQINANHLNRII